MSEIAAPILIGPVELCDALDEALDLLEVSLSELPPQPAARVIRITQPRTNNAARLRRLKADLVGPCGITRMPSFLRMIVFMADMAHARCSCHAPISRKPRRGDCIGLWASVRSV